MAHDAERVRKVHFADEKLLEEYLKLKAGKSEEKLFAEFHGDEVEIASVILEWFSHKEYERRFNYKTG